MQRYSERAVFAAHVLFALLVLGLITADLIAGESAVTGGRMSPLNADSANSP
jgi:hypothetical protein